MTNCSFCGKEIPKGTGTMFIKKDAKVFWFCSNKCEKNMLKLNRKPRNKAWTAEAKSVKESAKESKGGKK
jgi:large subunit ribosomal protein L24e